MLPQRVAAVRGSANDCHPWTRSQKAAKAPLNSQGANTRTVWLRVCRIEADVLELRLHWKSNRIVVTASSRLRLRGFEFGLRSLAGFIIPSWPPFASLISQLATEAKQSLNSNSFPLCPALVSSNKARQSLRMHIVKLNSCSNFCWKK